MAAPLMPLSAGSRVGEYEIVSLLGSGGMGEVYRARDGTLGRSVALKILPDAYAQDKDRIARFRREAQALAALNHPNIAQIYGLEGNALILELVEGPTLADMIAAAPAGAGLGVTQSLEIARQLVDALDAAHAHGIVHRDLKPANIKVRIDPVDSAMTLKVLDFGLAKALADESSAGSDVSNSPTITNPATARGVILGTAGYMAPEQALGRQVDKRADVWAFGVILYEMLTGRRPFLGADVGSALTETLTAALDLTPVPAGTPASVRRVLRRCLEKNPRQRLRDIGDARIELDDRDDAAPPPTSHTSRSPSQTALAVVPWILVAALALALAWTMTRSPATLPAEAAMAFRFTTTLPGDNVILDFAVAPSGRAIGFVGGRGRDETSIWVHDFAAAEPPRRIPGTDGAQWLFWSQDSRSIGFFVNGRIGTINLESGVLATACEGLPVTSIGAAWGPAGIIHGSVEGVRACGSGQLLTKVAGTEVWHLSPAFLPDRRHFVYQAISPTAVELRVASVAAGGTTTVIGQSDSHAVYSRGHLLYTRNGVLLAQPLDARTLTTTGDAFRVIDDALAGQVTSRRAPLSASPDGVLALRPRDDRLAELTSVDRAGTRLRTIGPPGHWYNFNLSPD